MGFLKELGSSHILCQWSPFRCKKVELHQDQLLSKTPVPFPFPNSTQVLSSPHFNRWYSPLLNYLPVSFSLPFFPSIPLFFSEMEFVLKLPGQLHAFPFISYYSVILVFFKQWTTAPRMFIKGNWESSKMLKFLLHSKPKENISSPFPKHLYPSQTSFAIKISNHSYK